MATISKTPEPLKVRNSSSSSKSKISSKERAILDYIGKFESKGGDYDILYGGYKGGSEKPLTQMTVREVLALQEKMKSSGSSAVGAHQFINSTLKEELKNAKISDDTLFTGELQDSLILNRLKRVRGFDKFLNGEEGWDANRFGTELSKEFASMPDPKTGRSYYDGDGLNKSLTSTDDLISQLEEIRSSQTAPSIPSMSVDIPGRQGLSAPQNFSIKEDIKPLEPIFDVKNKPTSQQQKPAQQQTSTSFLENYLKTNKFAKGGQTGNCGGPGQPPCEPIDVDSADDPRYIAYKDSLAAFNSGQQLSEKYKGKKEFYRGAIKKNPDGSYKEFEDYHLPENTEEFYDNHGLVAKDLVVFDNRKEGEMMNSPNSIGLFHEPKQPYRVEMAYKKTVTKKKKPTATSVSSLTPDDVISKDIDLTGELDLLERGRDIKTIPYNNTDRVVYKDDDGNQYVMHGGELKKKQTRQNYRDTNLRPNNNEYAMGGNIQQGQTPQSEGGMTQIPKSAGTHGQNPNGGVQVGTDVNGVPNTVEGGETMKQGYVYSDKLVLDETILKKVGLSPKFKGKTIAEVSKQMEANKTDQPNDKITADTSDENLEKLKNANEILRLTEELLAPNSPMGAPGGQETPQQQFLFGGPTEGYSGSSGSGPGVAGYGAAAGGLIQAANTAFGPTGIDTSGNDKDNYDGKKVSVGAGIGAGAAAGATAGLAFGPWGAAIGGVVGGAAGGIGASLKNKDVAEGMRNSDFKQMNMAALGGQFNTNPKNKKKLNKSQVNEVNVSTGIQFTDNGANALFETSTVDPVQSQAALNMGRYKGSNYFDITPRGTDYIVNPSQTNPQNAQGFKSQMDYLRQMNPEAKFQNQSYKQSGNRFEDGGYLNQFVVGGDTDPTDPPHFLFKPQREFLGEPRSLLPQQQNVSTLQEQDILTPGNTGSTNLGWAPSNEPQELQSAVPPQKKPSFWDSLGDKAAGAARYAPAAMNAMQLAKMDGPDVESLDRLGARFQPNYVDEKAIQDIAQSNYNSAASAIKGASGGSQGALRANLLAAHLNRTKGVSDAKLKGQQANAQQNARAQQFNLNIDKTNLSQSNQQKNINAQNKGAYDTNRSRLLAQIGTDIGNIGLEETRKKYPERLGLLYDYLGKYTG